MAERLRDKLLEEEKLVDLVVGPDAYRDLPNLVDQVEGGQSRQRPALPRGDLRRDQPGPIGQRRRDGVHQHHAGL